MFFHKYACVRQHDIKDCGAACLATIARHYGLKMPISRIREAAGTDRHGTSAYGLIKAAEKLGFTAKGVRGDREAFFSEFPLPAIAHVVVDGTLLHYVVVYRISPKQIIVADPAKGIVRYEPDEFFKMWTGVLILLVPTPSFRKGDETEGLFSRFLRLLVPHRRLLAGIFLASILYTVLGILGAFYFKWLIDEIAPYGMRKTLHVVSVGVLLLYLFQTLLNAFRSHLLVVLSQKLDIALILGYYHHVLRLPMGFFGARKTGEILSRLLDASKVRDAISSATLTIMIDVLMAVIGGAILYAQSATLFAVTVAVLPFYLALVWGFHKPFERMNRKQMEDNAALTSYMVESIHGMETVKGYNAEDKVRYRAETKFVTLLRSIFRLAMFNNVQSSLKMFVQLAGGVAILWVGAYQVLRGEMTIGQLITYNALLAYFLDPIRNLINLQPTVQTAVVAAERLGEILDLDPERADDEDRKMRPESLKGEIEIRNLDFRYGTRQLVLKNINLTIAPGEKIALVGESGSGKTTLVKLLMRFYEPEKGDIRIGGRDIRDISLDALRERIAYIPQDTFFFSGTIRENLCLGVGEDVDLERLVEACEVARANEFIHAFPLRYNTMLEENASNLSGGQKQRLAIARALVRSPDILIMDEATSHLDSTTEKAIAETIHAFRDMTVLIIAHRLSTIMRCDRIYVMDGGEIVECGTHAELMAKKGKYYHLWKDQLPPVPEDVRGIAVSEAVVG